MSEITNIATLTCSGLEGAHLVEGWVDEGISQLTRATLLVAIDSAVDEDALVASDLAVALAVDEGVTRAFHLVVVSVAFVGTDRQQRLLYRVTAANELTRLTYRSDVRMFQDMDAKAIVSKVLDVAGVPSDHVVWSVNRTLPKRKYCVQYRETDLDFVRRLLEHEGLFFLPSDGDDAPKITIADAKEAFTSISDDDVPFTAGAQSDGVDVFELEHRITTDVAALNDWNYETPTVKLDVKDQAQDPPAGSFYEPWGGYVNQADGKALAKIRAEELAAEKIVGRGRSVRRDFRAGGVFSLGDATQAKLRQKYVLRRVRHLFRMRPGASIEPSDLLDAYFNEFECHPESQPYRPQRTTPRPHASGAQPVVVTGPSGQEIHTDSLARMKGKFFWDRLGKDDDTSSTWMRLVQLPLGASLTLARVGWEMTVHHVHGDPDRPIAVARVYNASKPAPYGYPAAGSKMALQTASSPGGGKSNEIRMSDGSGGMEFFVNASKDMSENVLNDKTEKVDVNAKLDVGVDSTTHVGSNQKITVGASQSTTISAESAVTVVGDRTKTIGASETTTIVGKETIVIKGSDTETIGANYMQVAGLEVTRSSSGSQTLTVGGSLIAAAGKSVSLSCIGAKTETVGAAKIGLAASKATETVYGALALTVGGVLVDLCAADHGAAVKGASAVTVGGAAIYTAGSDLTIQGSSVKIMVGGMVNFLGGGGILNVTPGSVAFVGMVALDASGEIQLTGSPNLVG